MRKTGSEKTGKLTDTEREAERNGEGRGRESKREIPEGKQTRGRREGKRLRPEDCLEEREGGEVGAQEKVQRVGSQQRWVPPVLPTPPFTYGS